MKTVIAEKPSVAREIAAVLGIMDKHEGYLTGNGYYVTWALGHLVGLAMPEDYGVKGFQRESLPILPAPFQLTVRKIKQGKDYRDDPGARKQLEIIRSLFERSESIIVATDAGREGELIFRYIYEYLGCTKPFDRLWISSLTEKAIRHGLDSLKAGKDFDGLFHAGRCRSHADWLIGINATQALTIAAGSGVYSLGRVQTPTLAMICNRYLDNKAFKNEKYYQIKISHEKDGILFHSLSSLKWKDKRDADSISQELKYIRESTITAVETENVTEHPPLLFDLTGLQKEANKRYDLSAEETLNIAQGLYEKKFITYPRTGSRYVTEDIFEQIPALLQALSENPKYKEAALTLKWGRLNRRIVNELKVTDHHGLLTTDKIPSALGVSEAFIYDLIAFRVIESVSNACLKEIMKVAVVVGDIDFNFRGCEIKEPGWRSILGNFGEDGEDTGQNLPKFRIGDEIQHKEFLVLEKETKAPALYSEATLLAAMEKAGSRLESADEKKILQQCGIGTPATRASIIEILFRRDYIKREKKSIVPTEKGMAVFNLVKDTKIADVGMTAEWELVLQKIENGHHHYAEFEEEMRGFAVAIGKELLDSQPKVNASDLKCPKCRSARVNVWEKVVKCSDGNCGWMLFRRICEVTLKAEDIRFLIESGKTRTIKGMKSKNGTTFERKLILKPDFTIGFEKSDRKDKR